MKYVESLFSSQICGLGNNSLTVYLGVSQSLSLSLTLHPCVCVCVRARACARACVCVCVCERAHICLSASMMNVYEFINQGSGCRFLFVCWLLCFLFSLLFGGRGGGGGGGEVEGGFVFDACFVFPEKREYVEALQRLQ